MESHDEALLENRIKIGIDVHGVIDKSPLFSMFSNMYNSDGHPAFEIHIITGIKKELDEDVFFHYDYWFSIHQECEDENVEIDFDDKGRPLIDPKIWDTKKAEYCKENGIHIMIDDSPVYGEHFKGLETLYLQVTNTQRDNWRQE